MLVMAAGQAAMAKHHSRVEVATKLAQANDLARQGKLKSEIARMMGVSVMTLHRWRKEADGPDRARGGYGTPGGGTFWFQIFIQAPSPEIWSETISGGEEVWRKNGVACFGLPPWKKFSAA